MNPELKQFLSKAKERTDILNIRVLRPEEWMLQHLTEYNLVTEPSLMYITVRNSKGESVTTTAIVPFEVYSKGSLPPAEEISKLADTTLHQRVPVFFICPHKMDSLPLMGFSLKPVKFSPIGQVLVRRLNKLERVVHANIFRSIQNEGMLSINIDIVGVSKQVQHSDEIIDIDYSHLITMNECEDITQHDRILKDVETAINIIR